LASHAAAGYRFDCSGLAPREVSAHLGPWHCAIMMWPQDDTHIMVHVLQSLLALWVESIKKLRRCWQRRLAARLQPFFVRGVHDHVLWGQTLPELHL